MKKALSPIIAVLLITAVIIVANLVVYGWATGHYGQQLTTAGTKITILNVAIRSPSEGGGNNTKCRTCHNYTFGIETYGFVNFSSTSLRVITGNDWDTAVSQGYIKWVKGVPSKVITDKWNSNKPGLSGCAHCHIRIYRYENKQLTIANDKGNLWYDPYGYQARTSPTPMEYYMVANLSQDYSKFKSGAWARYAFEPTHGLTSAYENCGKCHPEEHGAEECYGCHRAAWKAGRDFEGWNVSGFANFMKCGYTCHYAEGHEGGKSWPPHQTEPCEDCHAVAGGGHIKMLHAEDQNPSTARSCTQSGCHTANNHGGGITEGYIIVYVYNIGGQNTDISRIYVNNEGYEFTVISGSGLGSLSDGLNAGEIVGLRVNRFVPRPDTTYEVKLVTTTGVEATYTFRA